MQQAWQVTIYTKPGIGERQVPPSVRSACGQGSMQSAVRTVFAEKSDSWLLGGWRRFAAFVRTN